MSFPHNRLWLGTVLVAGGAFGGAQASDSAGDLSKAGRLSSGETIKQARSYKQKMTETKTRIDALLDKARKQKDVIKINCLNDKSQQVKGHISVADQSIGALDTAVQRSDDGARQHEFM